jgi:hypothetical protein
MQYPSRLGKVAVRRYKPQYNIELKMWGLVLLALAVVPLPSAAAASAGWQLLATAEENLIDTVDDLEADIKASV